MHSRFFSFISLTGAELEVIIYVNFEREETKASLSVFIL